MDKNYVITLPVEDISEDQDFKFKLKLEIEAGN